MSWGLIDPSRLLKKKTWTDAGELARELWSMATDSTPAKVDRPVEIRQTTSAPALRVARAPSPASSSVRPPVARVAADPLVRTAIRHPGDEQRVEVPRMATGLQSTAVQHARVVVAGANAVADIARNIGTAIERKVAETVVGGAADYASKRAIETVFTPGPQNIAPGGNVEPARRMVGKAETIPEAEPLPSRSGALARKAQQQTWSPVHGKPEKDVRRGSSGEPYGPARRSVASVPHVNPVAEFEGPISFRGVDPAQFDITPRVLNQRTGEYDEVVSADLLAKTWIPWLTQSMRVCTVTDATAANFGSSEPTLGTASIQMYDLDEDTGKLTADGYGVRTAYHPYQFAWSGTGWAWLVGDNWFVRPLGVACVATGTIPSNSHNTCTLAGDYGGTSTEINNAMPSAVDNGSGGSVTIIAAIDLNGKLLAVAQNC